MKNLLKFNFDIQNRDWYNDNHFDNLDLEADVSIMSCQRDNYNHPAPPIFTIVDTEYTPADKDKLYFLPGVSVPRIKLKDLATQRGIKTTRDITNANAIFGSRKTLNKIIDVHWYNVYSTVDFKRFYETIKDKIDVQDVASIDTALEFYTEDIIITDHNGSRILTSKGGPVELEAPSNGTERFTYIKSDYEDLYASLTGGNVCTIYDESEILRHVNGDDCVTIDEDMYTNLSEMFKSDDSDNHTLAMEIMANCNYTDSLLYLEMLFMNYANTMYRSSSKNYVNFKGLLSYLDKTPGNMDTNIDQAMDSLREKGKMTKENVQRLLMKQCGTNLSISGSYKYFTIKSISLDKEYLEEIGEDLDFRIQADFTPEVQQEKEIEEDVLENEANEEAAMINTEAIIEEKEAEDMIIVEEETPLNEDINTTPQEPYYDL